MSRLAVLVLALLLLAPRLARASAAEEASCRSAIDRGARSEAIAACTRALEDGRTNENLRGLVRALVVGPARPTTTELAEAVTIASMARSKAPGEPTLIAATCDVAEAMGDRTMLRRCFDDLRRAAPESPETRRVGALLAPPASSRAIVPLGWSAIAALLFTAIARAVARRRRAASLAGAAAAIAMALVASPARADGEPPHGWLSKWAIDDAHPESSIPSEKDRNADPMEFGYWIQDLALKAERASTRGDHAGAARFYDALATAVPDRAVGFAKACDEYAAAGERTKAIDRCGGALLRDGVMVRDSARFVDLVVTKEGPLGENEKAALANVLQHLRETPAASGAVDELECEVATRTHDVAMLEECTRGLAAGGAHDDAKTISYRWALAVEKGQLGEATRLIDDARAAGVKGDALDAMTRTVQEAASKRRARWLLAALAVALLGGAWLARRSGATAHRAASPSSSAT